MGTAEILIVFSALMALIALVTIGIDWIGKPLKHRRFIPRMYRFDDEKLPVDEYGNTTFEQAIESAPYPTARPNLPPTPHAQAAPGAQVQPPQLGSVPVQAAKQPPSAPPSDADRANPTIVVPAQAPPRKVAQLDPAVAAASAASRSAFTDSLAGPETPARSGPPSDLLLGRSAIAGAGATVSVPAAPERSWTPAMALDMTVDDQKPSLAIKAERFWMATADANNNSHFDDDDVVRMAAGKAPRRSNPRTGKTEAMQLTGLRQASDRTDVRMRWPDDSVDPWSAS